MARTSSRRAASAAAPKPKAASSASKAAKKEGKATTRIPTGPPASASANSSRVKSKKQAPRVTRSKTAPARTVLPPRVAKEVKPEPAPRGDKKSKREEDERVEQPESKKRKTAAMSDTKGKGKDKAKEEGMAKPEIPRPRAKEADKAKSNGVAKSKPKSMTKLKGPVKAPTMSKVASKPKSKPKARAKSAAGNSSTGLKKPKEGKSKRKSAPKSRGELKAAVVVPTRSPAKADFSDSEWDGDGDGSDEEGSAAGDYPDFEHFVEQASYLDIGIVDPEAAEEGEAGGAGKIAMTLLPSSVSSETFGWKAIKSDAEIKLADGTVLTCKVKATITVKRALYPDYFEPEQDKEKKVVDDGAHDVDMDAGGSLADHDISRTAPGHSDDSNTPTKPIEREDSEVEADRDQITDGSPEGLAAAKQGQGTKSSADEVGRTALEAADIEQLGHIGHEKADAGVIMQSEAEPAKIASPPTSDLGDPADKTTTAFANAQGPNTASAEESLIAGTGLDGPSASASEATVSTSEEAVEVRKAEPSEHSEPADSATGVTTTTTTPPAYSTALTPSADNAASSTAPSPFPTSTQMIDDGPSGVANHAGPTLTLPADSADAMAIDVTAIAGTTNALSDVLTGPEGLDDLNPLDGLNGLDDMGELEDLTESQLRAIAEIPLHDIPLPENARAPAVGDADIGEIRTTTITGAPVVKDTIEHDN